LNAAGAELLGDARATSGPGCKEINTKQRAVAEAIQFPRRAVAARVAATSKQMERPQNARSLRSLHVKTRAEADREEGWDVASR
jgi:hypothetical protein